MKHWWDYEPQPTIGYLLLMWLGLIVTCLAAAGFWLLIR